MGTLVRLRLRRRFRIPCALAAALALAPAVPGPFAADTAYAAVARYVAPNGSDAAPGTRGHPWATIQKALDTLAPGETAFIRGGTYPAPSNFERSGRREAPVTIRNAPGAHPLITGRLRIRGSHLTVRGLHFRGRTA